MNWRYAGVSAALRKKTVSDRCGKSGLDLDQKAGFGQSGKRHGLRQNPILR